MNLIEQVYSCPDPSERITLKAAIIPKKDPPPHQTNYNHNEHQWKTTEKP